MTAPPTTPPASDMTPPANSPSVDPSTANSTTASLDAPAATGRVTPGPRRRRITDRLIALGLAVAVSVVGVLVYLNSDIRAAHLKTGPRTATPKVAAAVPQQLTGRWTAATDSRLGAVVSAYGVVVTTDSHSMIGRDATTGKVRWKYDRSNRTLCAVGSGDIDTVEFDPKLGFMAAGVRGKVRGIAAVYDENGFCSQVSTFDPTTGARSVVRTSANQPGGQLVFGGPYAGWIGRDLLEVWRDDLYRTIQYGVQPNPPKPNQSRLGCVFTDIALATTQFATVEHCTASGPNARLEINFDDPNAIPGHPDGWDTFQHAPRADIDTQSPAARIVGITADRVAVLVSAPAPAVVVYDAAGKEASRSRVNIPAADIVAADRAADAPRVTPSLQTTSGRLSLIGSHLISVTNDQIQTAPPPTSLSTSSTATRPPTSSPFGGVGSAATSTSALDKVDIVSLKVSWTAPGALGLPALVGDTVLMPVTGGLAVLSATSGTALLEGAARTIPIDRGGYRGRVDAAAVGPMIVEVRGRAVFGLSAK